MTVTNVEIADFVEGIFPFDCVEFDSTVKEENPSLMFRDYRIKLDLNKLPTSDPGIAGMIWRDTVNLKISLG